MVQTKVLKFENKKINTFYKMTKRKRTELLKEKISEAKRQSLSNDFAQLNFFGTLSQILNNANEGRSRETAGERNVPTKGEAYGRL